MTVCLNFKKHQLTLLCTGSPVNTFEFIQPLMRSLDYDLPKTSLAVDHALLLAKFFWGLYTILYPWLNRQWLPQPFILPSEVHKVSLQWFLLIDESCSLLIFSERFSPVNIVLICKLFKFYSACSFFLCSDRWGLPIISLTLKPRRNLVMFLW